MNAVKTQNKIFSERTVIAKWEQSFSRVPSSAGRYPSDPARIRRQDIWIDPITVRPQLQSLRRMFKARGLYPPDKRIYADKR